MGGPPITAAVRASQSIVTSNEDGEWSPGYLRMLISTTESLIHWAVSRDQLGSSMCQTIVSFTASTSVNDSIQCDIRASHATMRKEYFPVGDA